jgi:NAD(P)-dependent dehydrogenase (short-subunit alcohol dehydrogenase family)
MQIDELRDEPGTREPGRRCALVTGAGSGIGRATATWFQDRGWFVIVVDTDISKVPEGTVAVVGDVATPGVVESAVDIAEERCGAVTVLVNNAAHRGDGDILSCRPEDWQRAFDVNVSAAMRGIRRALPAMLARRNGCVANVASVSGLHGLRHRVAYSASKGALIALSRQIALDYGSSGVSSICLCPGATLTEGVHARLAARPNGTEFTEWYGAHQVIGRLLDPAEVAEAIGQLAGGRLTAALNGAVLTIDGGAHLSTPSDSSNVIGPAAAATVECRPLAAEARGTGGGSDG